MPKNAINLYESLRKQVLEGAMRPQGLSVMIYHGFLCGLSILAKSDRSIPYKRQQTPSYSVPIDADLIRLLANVVLYSQPEVMHVA